jgi:two-component system response regulator
MNGMEEKVILLVEDNPDDVLLIVRALKKNGVKNEVVVARDGVEALDYLFGTGSYAGRDTTVMPQLILLDLRLPKIDGLEVLRRVREDERTKLLPVVVLTSSRDDQDLVEGYGLHANSYVCKPVGFERFVEAVRQLKFYWLILNETPPRAESPGSEPLPRHLSDRM